MHTQQTWLQTGTILKKSTKQEESISSSHVETDADDTEPSMSASSYLTAHLKCPHLLLTLAANCAKREGKQRGAYTVFQHQSQWWHMESLIFSEVVNAVKS